MAFSQLAEAAMVLEYDGARHNYSGSVYKLRVNGKAVSTPLEPIIFNDRALVPVREVFEAMGAEVGYNGSTREISVSMSDSYMLLQINSPYAFVNGARETIPDGLTPKLIAKAGESAKTMVPLRFISENIGMKVQFDGTGGTISVNSPGYTAYTNSIKSIDVSESGGSVQVTATFSSGAQNVGKLIKLESGTIYCDIPGTDYSCSNNIAVNKGAVKTVRLGLHDSYTRIAVDTEGANGHSSRLSSDGKTLTITISGGNTSGATPAPPPTSAPSTPTPPPVEASPTPIPPAHLSGEKIVVIDAGHGGSDGGASYKHGDVNYIEKNINLAVAKKVRDNLAAKGISVKMTRDGDTYPTLTDRSDLANKIGAAMFVSIHSNASPDHPEATGVEVYYSATNNGTRYGLTSKKLADSIIKNIAAETGTKNRGVKTAQHVVTRTSEMPAVLVELGFISNESEAMNLYSPAYQDKLAAAIANAVADNLNSVKIPPDAK